MPEDAPEQPGLDASAFEEAYASLRAVAQRCLLDQAPGHTLQPTALLHEAWLKFERSSGLASPKDREHLLARASRAMRQILIDHARARRTQKRGGGVGRLTISGVPAFDGEWDLLALEDELQALAELDERQARIVECRVFGGMSVEQIADVLDVSARTVYLDWQMAKRWLAQRLGDRSDHVA